MIEVTAKIKALANVIDEKGALRISYGRFLRLEAQLGLEMTDVADDYSSSKHEVEADGIRVIVEVGEDAAVVRVERVEAPRAPRRRIVRARVVRGPKTGRVVYVFAVSERYVDLAEKTKSGWWVRRRVARSTLVDYLEVERTANPAERKVATAALEAGSTRTPRDLTRAQSSRVALDAHRASRAPVRLGRGRGYRSC